MPRAKRKLKPTFAVYCEGDTEQNYFLGMNRTQLCKLSIKTINMHGGGYATFLREIKKGEHSNFIAKFIIIDLDRALSNSDEKTALDQLINYCITINNRKGSIPHFLIIDNPDFEYISCMHIPKYNNQPPVTYIKSELSFSSINDFKKLSTVYEYLNTPPNSYEVMLSKLAKRKFITNIYEIKKSSMDITISRTNRYWDAIVVKGSNINELFDVIGVWS